MSATVGGRLEPVESPRTLFGPDYLRLAVLADAQSRLVQTLYQYNQSKLQLARNTGVVETQYKVYLGR